MVNVTSLLTKAGSTVGFSFGVRAWTAMEIWCVKSMYRLKLISSKNNAKFKEVKNINRPSSVQEIQCKNVYITQYALT